MDTFKALIARDNNGEHTVGIESLTLADLPDHPVLVKVDCSTINYKDGLAITGKSKICRKLPMVCGIDLAGVVVESAVPEWKAGDRVLVNGYGLSEVHWGGYAEYQRLKPEWLISTPVAFSSEHAMSIGTAGYTAMLCVQAITDAGIEAGSDVLVTGASGGVGSFAISLLDKLGFRVTAVTGSDSSHEWLSTIGAKQILSRDEFARSSKPLEQEHWAAVVDSVGGQTLVTAIAQTRYAGVVAACGLAGGFDLPSTVMPFILRNVRLQGIDSVMAPISVRQRAWDQLGQMLTADDLPPLYELADLDQVIDLASEIMAGKLHKRRVIKLA